MNKRNIIWLSVSQRLSRVGFEFEDEDKDGNFVLVALRFEAALRPTA